MSIREGASIVFNAVDDIEDKVQAIVNKIQCTFGWGLPSGGGRTVIQLKERDKGRNENIRVYNAQDEEMTQIEDGDGKS